jgi:hypothetical protein
MHRSRPFVLVILAAAAACSKHDSSEGNDILSQDRTLAAHLQNDKDARHPQLPVTCSAIATAAAPSAASQQQAEELTRQAGVAEMHGNIQDARSLLRRASTLDGTNKSAAYHLGRTSEALGDRPTAMSSYCRYLALAPTAAESVEARQRLTDLSRSMPRVTGSVSDSIAARGHATVATVLQPTRQPAHQPVRELSPVRSRVTASAPVQRTSSVRSSTRVAEPPRVVPSGSTRPQPVERQAPDTSTEGGDTRDSTSAGDVVATRPQAPATDPSSAPSLPQRRPSIGVQNTIIGAAAGAIFGAATGRSVKSAVIGAAAGGVLGTVVGTATRPARRSIRS